MSGHVVVLVLAALVVLVPAVLLGVVTLSFSSRHARPDDGTPPAPARALPDSPAARRARRHQDVVTIAAWAALAAGGAGAFVATTHVRGLTAGLLAGLVPATAGVALLAVHIVGELTWPRPSGAVRRAALARRTMTGIVPHGLARWTGALVAASVTLLVVTGLTADGSGRHYVAVSADGRTTGTAGPYPGWFYGAPLLAATCLVVGLTVLALRLILRRPAVDDTHESDDRALRTVSARRVLAGVQLIAGLTLAGPMLFAATSWRSASAGATSDGGHPSAHGVVSVLSGLGIGLAPAIGLTVLVVAGVALLPHPVRATTSSTATNPGAPAGRVAP